MKAFVTGGTGFMGSAVVRALLEDGQEVKALVRPDADTRNLDGLDVDLVRGDITDYASVRRAMEGSHAVYHLAAMVAFWVPRAERGLFHEVNVGGTRNVLKAADATSVERVVYTSTISTIGSHGKEDPATEEHSFNIWDMSMEYERSKYNAEFEALRFAARGLPVVIVLPTAPLGARDIKPNPAGQLILDFLARRLPGYLDGGANFIDVDDLAHGHLLAFKRGTAGDRYILGGENLPVRDLFLALEKISGVRAPRFKVPYRGALPLSHLLQLVSDRLTGRPPLITPPVVKFSKMYYYVDTTKAERVLGFRPTTPVAQAAAKAIRWFAQQGYLEGSDRSQNRIRERVESTLAAAA